MTAVVPPGETWLRALLAASPLPLLVATAADDLRLVAINQRFTELFGYRSADVQAGDAWWSRAYPDPGYRSQIRQAWRGAILDTTRGQTRVKPIAARVVCGDGAARDVEFHLGLYEGHAFVLCNDVTARKRAEDELTEARQFLQRVVDTSPSMIFVKDETGRAVFVNKSLADYYGTTQELMLSRATAEVHGDAGQAEAFERDDLDVIRTGKELVKEELNTAPDGRTHWFHTVKVPLVRPDGRVQCLGIATDITARKQAEEGRLELEAKMWQSQKLESLGVLAGGIAHDFNNLLASMLTNIHQANARLPVDSQARQFIQGIELATRRAALLTQQMLIYAGRGQVKIQTLRLDQLVSEMTSLLSAVVSKKASFRLELSPALVEADAAQLHQIVMNLIMNASDAMGERAGSIEIRTGTRQFEGTELHSAFLEEAPLAGRYAFLDVEDDGCGMPPETLSRIFEPFFSTKFTGRGLGLSAVLGIVRGHRGTIQVTSQPARGTRFVVLLPHAGASAAVLAPATEPRSATRGTLLVVEDEELVRLSLCGALEDTGFRVLAAGDGQEGLAVFRQQPAEIDAVVLDLTMPRMDGWQCLQLIRAIRADIPVVLMSGYAVEGEMPTSSSPAPSFLRKPFDPEDLVREVARLIAFRMKAADGASL